MAFINGGRCGRRTQTNGQGHGETGRQRLLHCGIDRVKRGALINVMTVGPYLVGSSPTPPIERI